MVCGMHTDRPLDIAAQFPQHIVIWNAAENKERKKLTLRDGKEFKRVILLRKYCYLYSGT